jgi:hypothetical protein
MRDAACSKLWTFFSGDIRRRTLLFVLFPLVVGSYFGVLALAVTLFPMAYDWRTMSISKLLYPQVNPQFHFVAAIGIAVTGLLMVPFAGYIHRRVRAAFPVASAIATALFAVGCICLIFAGLVTSHPLHGRSAVPRLHELLARAAAIGVGVAIMMFDVCAIKGYFNPDMTTKRYPGSLIVSWNLLVLSAILVLVLRLVMFARFVSLRPFYQAWRSSAAWHLGFWEWVGSAAVFLFLLCSAWLLPEHANE